MAICSLAREGVRAPWAFSAASTTAPAIASILTSRYPSWHGVSEHGDSALDPSMSTVAAILQEAGYTTGAIVANPVLHPSRNFGRGFDVFEYRMTHRERNRPTLRERRAGEVTSAALAWVAVARGPWFLWLHYQDPHGPYEAPDALRPRDAPDAAFLPVLGDETGFGGIPAYQVLPDIRSREAYEAAYGNEIRHLDGEIQRLLEGFAALGAEPGILLTADHGEAFGEDGFYFAHGHSLGVEQLRVPFLWKPPLGRAPGVIPGVVSAVDVAPTLLDAAGIPSPKSFAGRSIFQESAASNRTLYAEDDASVVVVQGVELLEAPRRSSPASRAGHVSLPRYGSLGKDGAWVGYDASGGEDLERAAEEFASRSVGRAVPLRVELEPETKAAIRALGYAE